MNEISSQMIELNYITTTAQLIPVLALAVVLELRYLVSKSAESLLSLEGLAFPISIFSLIIMGYCEFVLVDSLRFGYLTHNIKTIATVGITLSIVVLVFVPLDAVFRFIRKSKNS